ncbi:Meckelin [Baffinella frigidus]|nr:Meckelin [Cryptophyta sp. CCMP2293]
MGSARIQGQVDNLAQNASDAVILPSILHKIISSPPAKIREAAVLIRDNGNLCSRAAVLIRDNGNLYSRVLLYGIEYDLILFDLLVFVIWDLVFVDVFIAALLTYVMAHAIVELRSKYGTANVAAKTLVDERFLS